MLIKEFTVNPSSDFSLDNAVVFHDTLNPKIFDDGKMKPEIRTGLMKIAEHFEEFLGIKLKILDITISGSNAAFSYTEHSDLDLHLVVEIPDEPEYLELLDAKKNVYNARHDIQVKGIDVELYAQDVAQPHHSLGIYSVLEDEWVSEPKRQRVDVNTEDVREKYKNYRDRIRVVLDSEEIDTAQATFDDIKRMRRAGLADNGEFSTENLVFKMLRSQGWIEKLQEHIFTLQDKELSIEQRSTR
jgi:predicted nucleotidyltransferase